jgi:hypothetical protein
MRIGKHQNEQSGNSYEENEEPEGGLGGDEPCREGTRPKETPVVGELAGVEIFPVIIAVDVIIQNESGFESKESNQGDLEKGYPGKAAVDCGCEEIA